MLKELKNVIQLLGTIFEFIHTVNGFRRFAIRFHWFQNRQSSISLLATSHDMVPLMNVKQEVQVQIILDVISRFALCKSNQKTFVAIFQAEYPEKSNLNHCRVMKQNPKIAVSTPNIDLQKYFVYSSPIGNF